MSRAVILSLPRFAALRPQAAPAAIKSILETHGVSATVIDINLAFQSQFKQSVDPKDYDSLDRWMFTSIDLTLEQTNLLKNFINTQVDTILQHQPQFIFISVFCWQCQKSTRLLCEYLRKVTSAKIVIGGQGLINQENGSFSSIPYFAHELARRGLIDHWVRGEAESTVMNIVNDNLPCAGVDTDSYATYSDVNLHEFWDFSDTDPRDYSSGYTSGVLPMETSRGCIRRCSFCDIPTVHGGFRAKTGERLSQEIIHYYEKHEVENYFFHDALCNGSMKDFRIFNESLLEFYENHNLPLRTIRYSSHAIVRSSSQMQETDYELMSKAGADTMVLGVESGSERVRGEMRKNFSNSDLDYTMMMYSKYSIQVYLLLIVGFPNEYEEDFQQTLDMLSRYQKYVADGTIIGVNLGTTLTVEEGAPIYNEWQSFGLEPTNGANRPIGPDWRSRDNPSLTYKERIMRRIRAQEHAVNLGYIFWKGDDQMDILMDKYQQRLARLQGLVH